MNKNKRFSRLSLFLGLLLATLASKPARADGPISPPAQSGAALLNWSGFYIGGNAGGIWGDYGFSDSGIDVTVPRPLGGTAIVTVDVPAFNANSGSDFIGGVQAGYNRQFGSFVFGVEGDADGTFLGASKSFTLSSPMLDVNGLSAKREASTDWMLTGRLRFGYAWNRILLYGTGGIALTDINIGASDFYSVTAPGTQSSSDSDIVVGWTAGGGIEFAVSDAVSIAAEYRHSDFGGQNYDLNGQNRFTIHSTHVDLMEDQVTLRVNIRVDSLFHR
jgi:outer membrane immunogenic protein